jgi:hypothetical protein
VCVLGWGVHIHMKVVLFLWNVQNGFNVRTLCFPDKMIISHNIVWVLKFLSKTPGIILIL